MYLHRTLWVSYLVNIYSLSKIIEEFTSFNEQELFYKQWKVILKEVHIEMAQGLEAINCKISSEFTLFELAEKENERLITRYKKSKIDKHLQHEELKTLRELAKNFNTLFFCRNC